MMDYNEEALHFLYKNKSLSLLLERFKTSVNVRKKQDERADGRGHRLSEDCYINPKPLNHVGSIFRSPLTTSSASQPGYARRPLCPHPL